MAVVVDRASLLVDQIISSLRPLRNTLIAIGVFYSLKNVAHLAYSGFRAISRNKLPMFFWYPRRIWSKNYRKYGLVILNTDIINQDRIVDLWNRASFRVIVDGAANNWFNLVKERNDIIKPIPDLLTGDFDSIQPNIKDYYENQTGCNVIVTCDQNYTDFTKSLQQISVNIRGITEIGEIYAFVEYGGRLDHVMGLFQTLFQATLINSLPNILLISSYTTDWLLLPGTHTICLENDNKSSNQDLNSSTGISKSRYCGIIPLGQPCTRIETTGLRWNLSRNQKLAFGKLISTSNECKDETIKIDIDTPVIWTMEN